MEICTLLGRVWNTVEVTQDPEDKDVKKNMYKHTYRVAKISFVSNCLKSYFHELLPGKMRTQESTKQKPQSKKSCLS